MKKLVILVALALVGGLLVFYGGQTVKASHATGGPAANWPLDEGSGATAADSAHGNDGELSGGVSGNGLEFDGAGDYVEVSDDASLDITGAITIEAWVRPDVDSLSGIKRIVDKGKHDIWSNTVYNLDLRDGKVRLVIADNGGSPGDILEGSTAIVTPGEWHHVAGVFKPGDYLKVFLDGVLDGTLLTTRTTINTGNFPLFIGTSESKDSARFFEGRIDEVRISNAVVYTATFFVPTPPLSMSGAAGLWHMDDSVGTTAADASANGNHGTLMGDADWAGPVWSSSLSLDGVDDYVRVDDTDDDELDITDELSISAWIKPDVLDVYKSIVVKGDASSDKINYGLQMLGSTSEGSVADGSLRFFIYTSGYSFRTSTNVVPDDDLFHHVAVTVDAGTVKFYIDGSDAGLFTGFPDPLPLSTEPLDIGRHRHATAGASQYWDGMIEELQIYARVLSEAEIRSVALTGATGTLYVDDDSEVGRGSVDCDGDGFTVYDVIQDAVDAASVGDTINVCPGTYTENVDVTTNDLIIVSIDGYSATTVDGSDAADEVFDVTADGVTIQGFEIRNGGSDGGIRFEGDDNLFTENDVHDNTLYGIVAWDHGISNDNTITMNKVHDNTRSGILIGHLGNSGNVVSENEVYNNGAVWMGIELINSFEGLIEDNDVYSNPGSTGRYGIAIVGWTSAASVGSNTVSGNEVYGTGSGGFTSAGILVMAWAGGGIVHGHPCAPDVTFTDNVIEDNTVRDNDGRGIRVWAIQSDPFSGSNCGDGFITGNTMMRNTVTDNTLEGIILTEGADDNSVHRNTVRGNGDDGIHVDGDDNSVHRNTVEVNGGDGIHVDGDDNSVHRNTVEDNGGDGIHVDGDDNGVHRNTVRGNGGDGIHVDGDDNGVHRNTACGNTGDEILIGVGATANVVHHNTATITDSGTGTVEHDNTPCPP